MLSKLKSIFRSCSWSNKQNQIFGEKACDLKICNSEKKSKQTHDFDDFGRYSE